MKRILLILTAVMLCTSIYAQNPSWAKKAAGAVFTLKTFQADGTLLASSNGCFISEQGVAISNFTPFKGAQRAVVIDAEGKEYSVASIIGANDMYDVAKFKVDIEKAEALPLAQSAAASGASVWLLPYSAKKKPNCTQGSVSKAEQFQDTYTYYTLSMSADELQMSCPVLNEAGEVLGLLQPSADGKDAVSYAICASFAADMQTTGLSINDQTLKMTAIPTAIPLKYDDAVLSLFMASTVLKPADFTNYIDRFIQQYPEEADGYIYRARQALTTDNFASADEDMKSAVKVSKKKDEAHFQYAQLIYQKELYQHDKPFEEWSLDRALEESQEAYQINPQAIYRQQQAQILFAQQKYEEAYAIYDELTHSELRSADIFYAAAQCKLLQNDQTAALALADSAVNQFTKPYVKTAAPYLLARAKMLHNAGKFRPAVSDYNEYEALMSAQLTAEFYYLREQAEFAGHLYQQAINDIKRAVEMEPKESLYYVEKANIELRVGMIDEAVKTAETLLSVEPQSSEAYLLLGIAQCAKGNKQQGLEHLNKAKELGNSQAQTFIDKYAE